MASIDELLAGLPKTHKKKKIHGRHKLAISTATIRSDINVTPLVDVVLVLLIIFMVVTPMITRGQPVEMPVTEHHDKKSDSGQQIVVSITCVNPKMGPTRRVCGGHAVYVGAEMATNDQIVDKVQQEMRTHTDHSIYVKADKSLNYGAVRETLEILNKAGAPEVALGSDEVKVDEPKKGGK